MEIHLSGQKINYVEQNHLGKTTVVLVHGNSHSLRTFRNQFSAAKLADLNLIALDLPGHGESSPAGLYSLPALSNVFVSFVKTLGIEDAIFVGHSLGGHIIYESLDRLTPSGVLTFGAPPLRSPLDPSAFLPYEHAGLIFQNDLNEKELEMLSQSFFCKPRDTTIEKEDILKVDPHFKVQFAESVSKGIMKDEVDLLSRYKNKKYMIHGSMDKYINQQYLESLDICQVKCLTGGHNIHLDNPSEFNDAIIEISTCFQPHQTLHQTEQMQQ